MAYNHYNQEYLNELNFLYTNFNENDILNYLSLIKLVYKIYYSENIFIEVNKNIKYQLNSVLKLLFKKYEWEYKKYNNEEIQNLIDLLNFIHTTTNFENNYNIQYSVKDSVEKILLAYNYITEQDVKNSFNVFYLCSSNDEKFNFDNDAIIRFFNNYNIYFDQEILNINGTKIPNFYKMKKNDLIDHYYEFFHLLFKIYAPVLYYGKSFQEGYEYTITDKDIVFDCGGNMGLFSLYCASKGAEVYAFEPMSYIRDFLILSKSLYPDKIHIIPYGVGIENKEVVFGQTYNPGASNNIKFNFENSPWVYNEKCRLLALDEFCEKTDIIPTFIKADIEGAETEMLNGASHILKDHKPALNICLNHRFEDQYTIPALIESINPNYKFYNIYEGTASSKFVLCV